MNNPIFDLIVKNRKGNYCHAIEVTDTYEIECIVESLVQEFSNEYSKEDISEFLNSLAIYYIEDDSLSEEENSAKEEEVYSFDVDEYIEEYF